jgi:ABC-type multidrug transport system fused ATPase/permease subunit
LLHLASRVDRAGSAGTGVLLRAAIISAVYKRSLKFTQKTRGEIPNGKIVNHISTDVSRIDFAAGFFHMTWTAPCQFIVITIILLVEIGYSALPGIGFLLIAMPAQTMIMKKLFAVRKAAMVWTDKRAKLLQEILGGMRIVKFMAWEIPFLTRLGAIRKQELKYIRRLLWFRSGMMAFALSLPVLAAILAFITYKSTQHDLNPATVFTVLTLFQLMRMPLMIWPMSLAASADAWNGLKRLSVVFTSEIITEDRNVQPDLDDAVRIEHASFTWDAAPVVVDDSMAKLKGKHAAAITGQKQAPKSEKGKKVKAPKKGKVDAADQAHAQIAAQPAAIGDAGKEGQMGAGDAARMPGVSEKVPGEVEQRIFKLKDIDLTIPRGSLTAIVGPIGSGKSSLLQGMMGGELWPSKFRCALTGRNAPNRRQGHLLGLDCLVCSDTLDPERHDPRGKPAPRINADGRISYSARNGTRSDTGLRSATRALRLTSSCSTMVMELKSARRVSICLVGRSSVSTSLEPSTSTRTSSPSTTRFRLSMPVSAKRCSSTPSPVLCPARRVFSSPMRCISCPT